MANNFDQSGNWELESNMGMVQIPEDYLLDYGALYGSIDLNTCWGNSSSTCSSRTASSAGINHPTGTTSELWSAPSMDTQCITPPMGVTTFGDSVQGQKMRIQSEGTPRPARVRKMLSSEALERRRRQNRAAQLASRERTKKIIEELKGGLSQSVEFNQSTCDKLQEILEIAETLKKTIEEVLATQPPKAIHDRLMNGESPGESPSDT